MLAALQRLLVLGVLLITGAWLVWAGQRIDAVWLVLGAMFIALPHAWVLALEFALLRQVKPGLSVGRPTAAALVKAWWGEVWTGASVFGWRQPFRSNLLPDLLPPPDPQRAGRPGVLLVHGFVCNRGLWNPWMQALAQMQVPHAAVNLEPVFGSIDNYVPIIDAAVRRLRESTNVPPLIVAHSMGGLAVRAWMASAAADMADVRVVTVGTPHRGTWLARFGFSANARQMRQGSPWLRALAAREPPGHAQRFTCFFGHCDNIVFPAETATLPGADNRHIAGCAHVHLLFRPEVLAEVQKQLGVNDA